MMRFLAIGLLLLCKLALAQEGESAPKIIEIPYSAGAQAPPSEPPLTPAETGPVAQEPPPEPPLEPRERVIEALPPLPPPPEQLDESPAQVPPPSAPGAMIDGHPREGAFLSGPGSLTFIAHHTLMLGLGVLATQMVPRLLDANCVGVASCTKDSEVWTSQDARVAYLAGTLAGAAVGFGTTAWWQFNHWTSERSANFGIINSFFGGAFLGGISDLFSRNASVISWMSLVGMTTGAWLTAIVGGGDLPMNQGALIASGGMWAAIYTGLLLAIVVTSGGAADLRGGLDAMLITPALGATAMALATLKFNPTTAQVMRANLFGLGSGAAVLVLSALVLGLNFTTTPVPYILGGIAAIGAKTVVSLLWAEAAESPPAAFGPRRSAPYRGVW